MANEIYVDIHSTGLQPVGINSFPKMLKDGPRLSSPLDTVSCIIGTNRKFS